MSREQARRVAAKWAELERMPAEQVRAMIRRAGYEDDVPLEGLAKHLVAQEMTVEWNPQLGFPACPKHGQANVHRDGCWACQSEAA
ncbi:MAG: hypothetical protein RLP09_09725 [Sandaracinaceae bacterium]